MSDDVVLDNDSLAQLLMHPSMVGIAPSPLSPLIDTNSAGLATIDEATGDEREGELFIDDDDDGEKRSTNAKILFADFFSMLSLVFALVMVCMCLAGAVMNSVSLFIFTRPSFRKRSINLLLCGLSASKLAQFLFAIRAAFLQTNKLQ